MSTPLRPNIRDSAPARPSRSVEEHATVTELPLDALSDAALVAALLRGNERAAAVIWHRHSPAVRRMLQRSMGPDQEIEDLVQDVFVGFIKGARQLEDASTLRSYLVAIAFRVAAMEIRRRKVRRWVTLTPHGEIPETASRPDDHDERRALRALYEILDALPARDRLIFVARHVEGMQIEETAAALELSTATVWRIGKSSLDRVLTKARKNAELADYVERKLKGNQP